MAKKKKYQELYNALDQFINLNEAIFENEHRKGKRFGKRLKLFFKDFFGKAQIWKIGEIYLEREKVIEQAEAVLKSTAAMRTVMDYFKTNFDIDQDEKEKRIETGIEALLYTAKHVGTYK